LRVQIKQANIFAILLLNIDMTYSKIEIIISNYLSIMKHNIKLISILTLVILLSGCGLKGDLYFPDNQQSTTVNGADK
jgi:predicted small lipoprotein YifL